MYDNIGGKIKGLAKAIAALGIIVSVIIGIVFMVLGARSVFFVIGLIIMIVGSVTAWISCFLLYGFGEIVDKVCDIERNTHTGVNYKKAAEIERLHSQGLITQEEYMKLISKR